MRDENVDDLIEQGVFQRKNETADFLLHQMLQALDYLASVNIIHRDVKPANILYWKDAGFHFQLADFGLSNYASKARTFAGSLIWIAPEVSADRGILQTPKADVYSLFVVIVEVLNVHGFHDKIMHFTDVRKVSAAIVEACEDRVVEELRRMAHPDPAQRASAGDMLDCLYKGNGRVTARDSVARIWVTEPRPVPALSSAKQSKTGIPCLADIETQKAHGVVSKQREPTVKVTKVREAGKRRRHRAGFRKFVE